ncbi:MAG: hypothetical protein K2P84_02750 [Undibacterium sp.]|nr:hypothetical protein [Undibacterium sp.]
MLVMLEERLLAFKVQMAELAFPLGEADAIHLLYEIEILMCPLKVTSELIDECHDIDWED